MQWESGRTRRIYYILSEKAKQKRQTPSGVLSSVLFLNILYSPNLSYSSLPMLPQVGLEPTTLRLTEVPLQSYHSLLFVTKYHREFGLSRSWRGPSVSRGTPCNSVIFSVPLEPFGTNRGTHSQCVNQTPMPGVRSSTVRVSRQPHTYGSQKTKKRFRATDATTILASKRKGK